MARLMRGNALPWVAALSLAWSTAAPAQLPFRGTSVSGAPGMRTSSSGVASPPVLFGQTVSQPVIAAPLAVESRAARGRVVALPAFPALRPEQDREVENVSADDRLLQLLLHERKLLEDFGPDHPDVQSLRSRIEVARRHVEECRYRALELEQSRALPPAPPPQPIVIRSEAAPAPPPVVVVVPPPPTPEPPPAPTAFAETPVTAADVAPGRAPMQPDLPVQSFEPVQLPAAAAAPPATPLTTHHLPLTIAAVLVGFVVHSSILVLTLRRGRQPQAGPLRVELLNAPSTVIGPVSLPVEPPVVTRTRLPADAPAASPAEEAVYRQLLEQNLRLREEIHDLEDAAV